MSWFFGLFGHKKVHRSEAAPKSERSSAPEPPKPKTIGLEGEHQYNPNEGLELEHSLPETGITATVQEEKTTRVKSKTFTNPETGEQTVHEYTYDSQNRKTLDTISTGETIAYTYNGNSTKPASMTYNDADGNMVSQEFYAYDQQGNLVEKRHVDANGEVYKVPVSADDGENAIALNEVDVVRNKNVTLEDTNQVAAKTFNYDNGNAPVRHEYTYDSNNPSELIAYNADGTMESARHFAYDDMGRKTKTEIFDGSGALESSEQIYYAENGNILRNEQRDANGNITQVTNITYLADGSRNEVTESYENGSLIAQFTDSYDANNNPIDNPLNNNLLAQND